MQQKTKHSFFIFLLTLTLNLHNKSLTDYQRSISGSRAGVWIDPCWKHGRLFFSVLIYVLLSCLRSLNVEDQVILLLYFPALRKEAFGSRAAELQRVQGGWTAAGISCTLPTWLKQSFRRGPLLECSIGWPRQSDSRSLLLQERGMSRLPENTGTSTNLRRCLWCDSAAAMTGRTLFWAPPTCYFTEQENNAFKLQWASLWSCSEKTFLGSVIATYQSSLILLCSYVKILENLFFYCIIIDGKSILFTACFSTRLQSWLQSSVIGHSESSN